MDWIVLIIQIVFTVLVLVYLGKTILDKIRHQ
jgi:hypothetical protein